ncbi:MAG TPA: DUF3857 domain-containing protein [Dysgonomonas sp.]|nr:DUF3857 domain-containing protein [Dysgonomonas sp.]
MRTLLFTVLLALLNPFSTFSQSNYSEEWGRVTQYEMSMTEYENDPEAEAVVIYELGDNRFRVEEGDGFMLHMEKRVKIKILKQEGIKYADIEIPYFVENNRSQERIENVSAVTYNLENGELTKTVFDKKNMFEEKVRNDLYVKKIALADVREGSVIEYRYTIVSPFYFQMRAWEFQKKIPVIHSRLHYRAIPYYEYTYIAKGGIREFHEFETKVLSEEIRYGRLAYKEMLYEFGMKNLPAFRDEEFITSEKDYMIALAFQMSKITFPAGGSRQYLSTWPDMCDDLLKDDDFGKYMRNAEKEAKKILPALNLSQKSPLEQAIGITTYVKNMYKWNGFYGKYASMKHSDFMKQKSGNAADVNLFLTAMLKAAGLDAEPVVLSTRSNGLIRKSYPFMQFLNYVIAEIIIDGQSHFIDATEPMLYFDEIPAHCSNVEGLRVKPKSEEWVFINQKALSETVKYFFIAPDPEQQVMNVDIEYAAGGNSAFNFRKTYKGDTGNLADYLRKNNNITEVKEMTVVNYEELDKPFEFYFGTTMGLEASDDKIFIQPFCNIAISRNPFRQEKRTLPIDLINIRGEKYESEIEIPKGYKIEYTPKEMNHDSRVMSIYYKTEQKDGKVVVKAGYRLKDNLYDAKDYLRLKYSFNELIKQFSEMIIFVRE